MNLFFLTFFGYGYSPTTSFLRVSGLDFSLRINLTSNGRVLKSVKYKFFEFAYFLNQSGIPP